MKIHPKNDKEKPIVKLIYTPSNDAFPCELGSSLASPDHLEACCQGNWMSTENEIIGMTHLCDFHVAVYRHLEKIITSKD